MNKELQLFKDYYYGASLSKSEMERLQDSLKRCLNQLDTQLFQLKQFTKEKGCYCQKCDTDEHVSIKVLHTEYDEPYQLTYCEKCYKTLWEEDHE